MGLAQAHHHEAGQEKEHDVDQRDDLDPRVLLRDGRSHFHDEKSVGRASKREGDRDSDTRRRSGHESRASERRSRRIIQNRTARALAHARIGNAAIRTD